MSAHDAHHLTLVEVGEEVIHGIGHGMIVQGAGECLLDVGGRLAHIQIMTIEFQIRDLTFMRHFLSRILTAILSLIIKDCGRPVVEFLVSIQEKIR